jgi:hypothetical protein
VLLVANVRDKLRDKWFAERGFHAPDATPYIEDSHTARAENRQSTIRQKFRKPYKLGEQPARKEREKRKALSSLFRPVGRSTV